MELFPIRPTPIPAQPMLLNFVINLVLTDQRSMVSFEPTRHAMEMAQCGPSGPLSMEDGEISPPILIIQKITTKVALLGNLELVN